MVTLDTPIQYLKGVGPYRAKLFSNLRIYATGDLLKLFPRRYVRRKKIRELKFDEETLVCGNIVGKEAKLTSKGETILIELADDTGVVGCTFFHSPFLKKQIHFNDSVCIIGKTTFFRGRIHFINPEIEDESLGKERIIPVYPLTGGLRQKDVRRAMQKAITCLPFIEESLPDYVLKEENLLPKQDAVKNLHFPLNMDLAEKARERLGFEELFYFELIMALRKMGEKRKGIQFKKGCKKARSLLKWLGFEFTRAQKRVLWEIFGDMESPYCMARLLQGDVGSGKTIIAIICMLKALESGYQSVVMAPTEILAEQHYLVLKDLLSHVEIEPYLLTGSRTTKEKREIYKAIESGTAEIVVGTHALIESDVKFKRLGFVVVDEQHRFGVMQRMRLRKKGENPDFLVMTATPIPRSLSLTVYGDLDLSILDELPPGRKKIETRWVRDEWKRDSIYEFVRKKVNEGRQVYIVYPLIEESEKLDLKAATEGYETLKKGIFKDFRLELLHGRMKGKEKERIMSELRDGKIDILVSTTVIEVGVDVPNATIMLVEHADRFGLAGLHQLRGRVGRGSEKSYCILITRQRVGEVARERLKTMETESDGFKLAEKDLKLRGPGEFFGTRQHGLPELSSPELIYNTKLLSRARNRAFRIVNNDPEFSKAENRVIKEIIEKDYREKLFLINTG